MTANPGNAPISRTDIEAAAHRIGGYVRRTPVIALEEGAFGLPAALFLKLESLQHAGSFKARGAFNALLSARESSRGIPAAGVIAASGGNHGAAVAYAAQALGLHAEIFVPQIASPAKVQRLRDFGAEIRQTGATYAEALAAAQVRQAETGALSVHAYDEVAVLAGQGTLAREFEAQIADLDTVLVAVGGGGLIGGIAAWHADAKQGALTPGHTRIIGVEPMNCPTLHAALSARAPVDVEVGGIAADSLGAKRVGNLMFEIARRAIDRSVLVEDEAIRATQRLLWRDLRLAVETGGATALAALVAGAYKPRIGERIGVVICGGNADLAHIG
ncbi:threonine/serine dehydratase [Dongia soli]|uniref:Threonine/serine dehydratase n=1 Tax=Dongia soli TaxID=600628 RepID=A0ABU5E7Y4_9PROT|nr:threonine/serine dehydratase [Dongia soli]MDY0882418.1 threonine/serine dehydratase [Dongia soli]